MIARRAPPFPPPTLGMGSVGQNKLFENMGMLHIKLKRITNAATQHVGKYFARSLPPSPNLGVGSVGQNSTFPEYVHIAYQFKKNHECSKMVATILPADPLSHPPS